MINDMVEVRLFIKFEEKLTIRNKEFTKILDMRCHILEYPLVVHSYKVLVRQITYNFALHSSVYTLAIISTLCITIDMHDPFTKCMTIYWNGPNKP